jgi:ribosomal protein S18 acetylase RimI-like enzyme
MTVTLRPMTPEEFVPYEDPDVHHFAENMVQVGFWSTGGALDKAKDLHARLLPEGIHTPDHLFFVIEENQHHDSIGVLWLFIDRETEPSSGFLSNILVHMLFRGQGLGKQAMLALEQKALELGLASLALNVFENNPLAKALYTSLGYQVQSSNMRKLLRKAGPNDPPI